MKYVYVVVQEYQLDSGENELEVIGVYDTIEKAKDVLEKLKEISLNWWKSNFGDNYTIEESNTSVCIFETDEYCYNHERIIIFER